MHGIECIKIVLIRFIYKTILWYYIYICIITRIVPILHLCIPLELRVDSL